MAARSPSAQRAPLVALALLAALAQAAQAATWECRVTAVWSPLLLPEADYLARTQPTLRLEEPDDAQAGAVVTRCARDPARQAVRCTRVEIDWVAVDAATAARKYYNFAEHYDLQLFFDRSFVENDGRGGVVHGRCRPV